MSGAGHYNKDNSPDTHDQVDHGDGVKIDSPECHKTQNSNLDADNGECNPKRADRVRNKDE